MNIILGILLLFSQAVQGDTTQGDTLQVDTLSTQIPKPDTMAKPISPLDTARITFDFKDADVRDVLRAIGIQAGVNIVVDKSVEGTITVHLENIVLEQGLTVMLEANGFSLEKQEGYYLVKKSVMKQRKEISATTERITVNIENLPIVELIREIAKQSKINIVADQTVTGEISGILYEVPLEKGLATLLSANGFILRKSGGIYEVTRATGPPGRRKGLSVTVDNQQLVSLDVSDADIGDVLDEISAQANLSVVQYGQVQCPVNARMNKVPLEASLALLFQGTNFTYRKVGEIYLVGDKNITSPAASALTSSKLIPLSYIKADLVPQFLPRMIPPENVKVVKEQNAILVFGTEDMIDLTESFIKTIDLRSPQVLIEAMIVEYSKSTLRTLGFRGMNSSPDSVARLLFPDFSYAWSGEQLNEALDNLSDYFNITSLGRVPESFWLMIDALETRGKAKVKARPRIATLNGNEASINVGYVSYYETSQSTPSGLATQLHSIDAGINLKIIPWVSKAGEITTVIQTEVSNVKSFGPGGLPEIARRTVNTTINLKDGETIALGGLIQVSNIETRESVPILGSIPIIGKLFSHTTTKQDETELVIYITPRVLE